MIVNSAMTERLRPLSSYHFVDVFELWGVSFFVGAIFNLIKLNLIGRLLPAFGDFVKSRILFENSIDVQSLKVAENSFQYFPRLRV